MKKILIIECLPGTVPGDKIERDITHDVTREKNFRLNEPANGPMYAGICMAIAINGYNHPDTSDTMLKYIAPSQIKFVTIEFRK